MQARTVDDEGADAALATVAKQVNVFLSAMAKPHLLRLLKDPRNRIFTGQGSSKTEAGVRAAGSPDKGARSSWLLARKKIKEQRDVRGPGGGELPGERAAGREAAARRRAQSEEEGGWREGAATGPPLDGRVEGVGIPAPPRP